MPSGKLVPVIQLGLFIEIIELKKAVSAILCMDAIQRAHARYINI